MAKPKEKKARPTIKELEDMMGNPEKPNIRIQPDGSITTIKQETVPEELIRLRRENESLAVELSGARNRLRRIEEAVSKR